ncbi:MAG TPA: cyclophilin-like fold protein [Sunxiuqinia sp.]|nr:cyclophilin-like fold protein [Sunxiuqinia sp.]
MKINIHFQNNYSVEAEIFDSPTGRAIYNALPFQATVNTWGDEIYFPAPADSGLEPGAQPEVAVGNLAYWPPMPAFCIFFGPTPMSSDTTPVAASAVNVFGRLMNVDIEALRSVPDGTEVRVEKAE